MSGCVSNAFLHIQGAFQPRRAQFRGEPSTLGVEAGLTTWVRRQEKAAACNVFLTLSDKGFVSHRLRPALQDSARDSRPCRLRSRTRLRAYPPACTRPTMTPAESRSADPSW